MGTASDGVRPEFHRHFVRSNQRDFGWLSVVLLHLCGPLNTTWVSHPAWHLQVIAPCRDRAPGILHEMQAVVHGTLLVQPCARERARASSTGALEHDIVPMEITPLEMPRPRLRVGMPEQVDVSLGLCSLPVDVQVVSIPRRSMIRRCGKKLERGASPWKTLTVNCCNS